MMLYKKSCRIECVFGITVDMLESRILPELHSVAYVKSR
jgi:hypothetical protein